VTVYERHRYLDPSRVMEIEEERKERRKRKKKKARAELEALFKKKPEERA